MKKLILLSALAAFCLSSARADTALTITRKANGRGVLVQYPRRAGETIVFEYTTELKNKGTVWTQVQNMTATQAAYYTETEGGKQVFFRVRILP